MPAANDEKIDTLIKEVRELKSDIKELRMLVTYELLQKEEQRSRGTFNDTLLSFTKQALKAAVEQLADLEGKPDTRARETPRPTKVPVKSRKDVRKPTVDVDKEIAILKNEMATSLRNAAKDIEDEHAEDEERETRSNPCCLRSSASTKRMMKRTMRLPGRNLRNKFATYSSAPASQRISGRSSWQPEGATKST